MSDRANKRDDIKKHVRALLMSTPVELTVGELKRDFHDFIGEPLDYRGMGYSCLEDFLRDIGDAVQIGYKGGMMTLKAKADETTKHIQSLVSKQRVSNKKKYAVYRQRGGGPRRMYQQSSNQYQPRRQAAPSSFAHYTPPTPMVPAHMRNQIREMFKLFPYGLDAIHLNTAFERSYGTGVNYRHYGFQNQFDFLQSLKDIVTVSMDTNTGVWKVYPVKPATSPAPVPLLSVKISNNLPSNTPNKTPAGVNISPTSQDSKQRPSKGRGCRRQLSGGSDGSGGKSVASVGSNHSSRGSRRHSGPNPQLEAEIQQVVEKFPKGIWASRFPLVYQETHKKVLDVRDHGYVSVIDFMANIPNIVTIIRPSPQGDWMLYDTRTAPPPPAQEETSKQTHSECGRRAIEQETKRAISKVLEKNPSGIPIKDFPDVYQEFTGQVLPFKDLGFETPDNLFVYLTDSVLQIAYTANSELKLFSMDTNISDIENESRNVPRPAPTSPRSGDFPEDVVGPGCHYVPVMCPEAEEYVELFVSNITHPGLFWVFLRHKTKSLALETLMDNLEYAYRHTDEYKMPEKLMVRGQVCATLFPEDNNWHRGVITGRNEAGFIEVYYVDYGNTNFVQKDTLCFLKREFLILPAQAIQCRLAHLQPKGAKWKTKSRLRLIELTRERPLIALVHEVKNQMMSLVLIDTNDPQVDKHINDILFNEGHAVFKPDEETPCILDEQLPDAPDYNQVFGWNHVDVPRLPKVAQRADDAESVTSNKSNTSQPEKTHQSSYCYIRWFQLTEKYMIHVINLDRTAYLVSEEISNFFWEDDILTSMLKKKRLNVPKRVVCSDEHVDLFKEFSKYKITSPQNDLLSRQHFLSLYPLKSLPDILAAFECDDEYLIDAVQKFVPKFDPDSPYWQNDEQQHGVGQQQTEDVALTTEEVEQEEEITEEQQISIEEKQMALQALQFKRKRILQTLMNNPTSTVDVVNQLNDCEVEIMMIKDEIAQHKGAATSAKSTGSSTASTQIKRTSPELVCTQPQPISAQAAENQRVIQNIINSSTKPIATANIMTKPVASMANIRPGISTETPTLISDMSNQSATGSYPGMMGMGMNLAQQQQLMNPLLLGAPGTMTSTGMGDMSNMLSANLGMMPGFGATPGLLPQLNPLLMQQLQNQMQGTGGNNLAPLTSQMNQLNLQQMGGMPPAMGGMPPAMGGRGQVLNPGNMGILPGLLPLVQNLSSTGRGMGRGAAPGNFKGQ